MCTAVSFQSYQHYFGRNLDLDRSYQENIVITPRKFPFKFRYTGMLEEHYALIGMAAVFNGVPLYYDATNEKGLSMAGLNFPGYAVYHNLDESKDNIASFEFIPWILGKCSNVEEAKDLLQHMQMVNTSFSKNLPVSPLHWLISDSKESITVECVKEGLKVYENPWGILTNNPPFDYHLLHMNQYMNLHEGAGVNRLTNQVNLENYSLGFGAMGLPGDYSSISRFVKAAYVKSKSVLSEKEMSNVNQFFHILRSVAMPKGCVLCPNGEFEYTRYSSCCNTATGVYSYTTYDNSTIRSVDLYSIDLNLSNLEVIPLDE